MQSSILETLERHLRTAKRALIATHENPDGDALGSAAAFAHMAGELGVEARILLPEPLPDFLDWLPLPVPCVKSLAELGAWVPDLVLVADCGDARRTEPELAAFLSGTAMPGPDWKDAVTVNIDHHVSNPGYARINWVEPDRAATGELAGALAEHLGMSLGGDLGEALYLTLASDTGNFSYANTTPGCLAMASRIVEAGFSVGRFTEKYTNNWSLARMHLWGRLMSEITLHEEGAIACCIVPKRYLEKAGLGKADLEGIASWLRRLRGVRVSLFVREDAPNRCKISLRSMGDVDVRTVAAGFGGGGHAAAAGADISLPPDEVARQVIAELAKQLKAPSV